MSDCHSHCHGDSAADRPLIGRKLRIMLLVFGGIVLLSFLPQLHVLNESLLEYLGIVWWGRIAGAHDRRFLSIIFVPDGFMIRFLGQKSRRTLLHAVVAGFLMSACSHGILAIAIQLYKKGASVPAVITFLLASPWANLPMTILMFGFFGWKALLIIVGAMVIALTTGAMFMWLDSAGLIESSSELGGSG